MRLKLLQIFALPRLLKQHLEYQKTAVQENKDRSGKNESEYRNSVRNQEEPKDHCVKHYVIIYGGVQQNEKTSSGLAVVLKKAQKGVYCYKVINENKVKLRCLISKGYI